MKVKVTGISCLISYLPYLPTYPPTNKPTSHFLNEFKKAAASKARRPSIILSV